MGAPLSTNFRSKNVYKPIDLQERLRETGVEVNFDEVTILKDRTLAYKGFRVLLYIRDVSTYGLREEMPKFHLAFCGTLDKMQRNKRFARYVVANREDGFFLVNIMENVAKPKVLPLNVCQMCLATIAWNGFRIDHPRTERVKSVNGFALKDFFIQYPRDLIADKPIHTSETAPLNDYTRDWGDISERTKQTRGYRCSKCKVQFGIRDSKYMHVHHVNGMKNDNSDLNLSVLCIRCHANEPMHGHMKSLPNYLEFIKRYPT
jgi:hypothetical protein